MALTSNLCIECHQGRESTVSVNKLVKGLKPDEQSDKLRFLNVHYFAAGATLFGDLAKGAYEFDGQTYLGQNKHGDLGPTECVQCHNTHALTVQVDKCSQCHKTSIPVEDLRDIRMPSSDAGLQWQRRCDRGHRPRDQRPARCAVCRDADLRDQTVKTGIVYDREQLPVLLRGYERQWPGRQR